MFRRYLLTLFRAIIHDKARAALAGYIGPNPRPLVRLRRGRTLERPDAEAGAFCSCYRDMLLEGANRIGQIKQDIQRTSEVLSRSLLPVVTGV
jgi:hypothetical protein